MVCDDFNLIYKAEDKNNLRLNRRLMGAFRSFLDELELAELHLLGRMYTWSNEESHPTLSCIDRAFVCARWIELYLNHALRALSSMCSDHSPLLLQTNSNTHMFFRFKFEYIWSRFPGYLEAVVEGWCCMLQNTDACRILDLKLWNTTKSLKRWSQKFIDSVRLQLVVAKEVVFKLE
jgi:hypothetical protein